MIYYPTYTVCSHIVWKIKRKHINMLIMFYFQVVGVTGNFYFLIYKFRYLLFSIMNVHHSGNTLLFLLTLQWSNKNYFQSYTI